jgi:hypothetical protein
MDYINELVTKVGSAAGALSPSNPLAVTTCSDGMVLDQAMLNAASAADGTTYNGFDVQCQIDQNWTVTVVGDVRFRSIKNDNVGHIDVTGNAQFDSGLQIATGDSFIVRGNVRVDGAIAMTAGSFTVQGDASKTSYSASCTDVGTDPETYSPFVSGTSCMRESFFVNAGTEQDTTGAAFLYTKHGFTQSGGSLALRRTFVYGENAATGDARFDLGGGGNILWTPPTDGPFTTLALWSDHVGIANSGPTAGHRLQGGGTVLVNGVFFTPEAHLQIAGNCGATPQDAQFFARSMFIAGTANFKMRPDPHFIPVPVGSGTRLIR